MRSATSRARAVVAGLYHRCVAWWQTDTFWVSRLRLFVASYAPLGGMFAARFASQERWLVTVGFSLFAVWGVIDGWRLVKGSAKRSKRLTTANHVSDQGTAVSGYLATYLLPFLGNLPQNSGDWIAYALYFAVALTVYVHSDLALVNPTLYAFGYKVLKGTIDGRPTLLVSPVSLQSEDRVEVSGLLDVVVVHRVCDTDAL